MRRSSPISAFSLNFLHALVALSLWLCSPAHAQLAEKAESPVTKDAVAEPAAREIAVSPDVRDVEISARLERILEASGWFSPLDVTVREGIVFLDGQTETEERRKWAEQLASRTEAVVAVVNRIKVERPVDLDLAPTWKEFQGLIEGAKWFAPIALVSLVILALFWIASSGVAMLSRRSFRKRFSSPLLADLAARALALPVILIGIYLVLQLAGLTRLAVTLLGGTGLIGIIIGFAFREIAENALASILLSARNPFRTGDWIRIDAYEGIVQNLNMRTTILMTLDGNHVQIPNATVFKSVITNYSSNPNRRAEFKVGIGYPDSIAQAQAVIIAALRAHPAVLDDPEPAAIVDELAASTVNLRVLFWFDGKAYSILRLRSSLMRQVKRALEDAGISMPGEGREIIFPEGVSVRLADERGEPAPAPTPAYPPAATPSGASDAAVASTGEGDLTSDEGDLKRQTKASALPEAGANLLTSSASKAEG